MGRPLGSIVIADYGMGNLFNIQKAVNHLGGKVEVSSDPHRIISGDRVILPGVGAFGDGMNEIKKRGIADALRDFVRSGKPLLGICLGMQLLMEASEEFGLHEGLGFIPGRVRRLKGGVIKGQGYKVPHVGWNRLYMPSDSSWGGTVFDGIQNGSFAYFVHSYVATPEGTSAVLANTFYGEEKFCSAVTYQNIIGCQFHPEISAETGLQILGGFLHAFR